MSRHRHEMQKKHHEDGHHKHHRASGGRTEMKVSGNPDVFEEAHEEHKKGGRVKKKKHHEMHAEGHKPHHRMDRPKRAKGGRVKGSDMNPFSSAHNPSAGPEPAVEDNRHYKVSSTKDTRDNSKGNQN